jgi:hypothetical protein
MYRSYSVEYQVQVKCTTTVVHVCVHTPVLPVCTGLQGTVHVVHTQVLVGTLHATCVHTCVHVHVPGTCSFLR